MTIVLQVIQGDQPAPARDFESDVIRIGRDPSNDVVLGETGSGGVSRHHAELRYANGEWRVVDLNSSNGTFLRGRRVTEAPLRDGDEVQFAPQGPRVKVSLPTALGAPSPTAESGSHRAAPASSGVASMSASVRSDPERVEPSRSEPFRFEPAAPATTGMPSDSELLPLRMGLEPISARGYLVPGLIGVGTIAAVLWAFQSGNYKYGLMVTMLFFVIASVAGLYLLCGKSKPLGPMVAAAFMVAILVTAAHAVVKAPLNAVVLPYVTKQVPGKDPNTVRLVEPDTVPGLFVYHLVMVALPEELEKIFPALIGLYLALKMRARGRGTPLEEQFAVREPLDGILLGIAGAAGFHFVEALQYADTPLDKFAFLQANAAQLLAQLGQKHGTAAPAVLMQMGFDAGMSAAFQVIFRGLSSVFSHLGYSGIFGYYVGLAALRPQHKGRLLARGLLTACLVHAIWNSTNQVTGAPIVVTLIAFALLITSIIKARSMSPTRTTNFATTLGRAT